MCVNYYNIKEFVKFALNVPKRFTKSLRYSDFLFEHLFGDELEIQSYHNLANVDSISNFIWSGSI